MSLNSTHHFSSSHSRFTQWLWLGTSSSSCWWWQTSICTLPRTSSWAICPPGQCEKQRRPWHSANSVQPQLKHRCVINTVFITNPKHSTIRAAVKKIISTPATPSALNLPSLIIPGSSSVSFPAHCRPIICNINVDTKGTPPEALHKHFDLKEHRGASGRSSPPQDMLPQLVLVGRMNGEGRNMAIP